MENRERSKYFNDKKVIGIDPGKEGGIGVFSITQNTLVELIHMPATPKDLLDLLKIYSKNSVCYLESVHGMPGQSGSGMFNFGKGFGHIEMALMSLGITTTEVTPQRWQKIFCLGTKGKDTSTVWKNKLKTKAQQLYPKIKITLATSDACLITEYGSRNEKTLK